MRIAILGLGYVGTTTAACLAKDGHHVLGVDINAEKVAAIGEGRSPVVEPLVDELLRALQRHPRRRRHDARVDAKCEALLQVDDGRAHWPTSVALCVAASR